MPNTEIKTYQCRHIFAGGHRCGSKSLRHEEFCYYHHTTRKPQPRQTTSPNTSTFELAFPEDRPAIQASIGEILRRLATNTIDIKRAGLILYALQIASMNLPRAATPDEEPTEAVDEIELHPTLGVVAPPTEYVAPEKRERPLTLAGRLLKEIEEMDRLEAERNPTQISAAAA